MRLGLIALFIVAAISGRVSAQTSERAELAELDASGLDTEAQIRANKPITEDAWQALQQRYEREPKVDAVVAAALQAARGDPNRYADMASRSRLRGLIPHLDLGVRRGQGIDLRWTLSDDLADNRTTADDVMLFATLRFDLDRLLFSAEEVSIAREQRSATDVQHILIRKVVHVYFVRRRLLLERDLLGGTSIAQQLRIQEAEALLNAFTDGAWKRMLTAKVG
ncbi:MAG: hypothetical protein RL701_8138 [Pseudomonadota bacterium]|jgi:hypothetical protein